MLVEKNVPLQPHNSFGIVAKALSLVRIGSEADLAAVLANPALQAVPKFIPVSYTHLTLPTNREV